MMYVRCGNLEETTWQLFLFKNIRSWMSIQNFELQSFGSYNAAKYNFRRQKYMGVRKFPC